MNLVYITSPTFSGDNIVKILFGLQNSYTMKDKISDKACKVYSIKSCDATQYITLWYSNKF